MILELIKRMLRSGWHSFSRDGEIAVATIFILFLAVTLVGSLFIPSMRVITPKDFTGENAPSR